MDIKPIVEGGCEYNLADVLVSLHGSETASKILRGMVTSELIGPTLSAEYAAALISEANRVKEQG